MDTLVVMTDTRELVKLVERLRRLNAYGCCTEAADTIESLQSRLAAAEADAEPQCGCEWDDAGELDAACMKHWKYFWQLHGPHCTAKSPQNFTAGTDPAIWNIADAARSEEKP